MWCLDLFRYYYKLRWMESNRISGCCGFHLPDGMKAVYIPFQCPSSRSQWWSKWFYFEIKNLDPVLMFPEDKPEHSQDWTTKPFLTPSLQEFVNTISSLQEWGLTGYEVSQDFITRCIQPLQARAHRAFDYMGKDDETRISTWGTRSRVIVYMFLLLSLYSYLS